MYAVSRDHLSGSWTLFDQVALTEYRESRVELQTPYDIISIR